MRSKGGKKCGEREAKTARLGGDEIAAEIKGSEKGLEEGETQRTTDANSGLNQKGKETR